MVVKSFLVAMCRWRSVISHWQAILLLVSLSAVQVSSQQPTYIFSESNIPVRICPVVVASDVNPSLVIRPSSSTDAFLTGQFTYPTSGTTSERFIFPPPCNDSPCTELSIRYNPSSPPARDSFNVGYAGSEGSGQATIQIDYATKGIYLQYPGVVLRPVDGSENLDQGMLVYLGDLSPPFITCHAENQTEARVVVAINIGGYEKCATSVGGGGQPTFLELRYDPGLAMGTHRLYTAAEGNCSSDQRSEEFNVSFESPPPTTPEPGVTTTSSTDRTDGTGGSGNNTGSIVGGVLGGAFVILLLVLGTVFGVRYIHKRINKQGERQIENGAASPFNFVYGATQTTNHNGTSNGHVNHPATPSLKCIYIGGKHYKALDECLGDCHDVVPTRLDDNGTSSIRGVLSGHECIVYIIQDSAPEDEHNAFITELECMPSNEKYKTKVFVLRFKSSEQRTMEHLYYYQLERLEDPSSDRFDASSCAKAVVNEVRRIRGEDRPQDPEPSRTNNLTDGPGGGGVVIQHVDLHVVVNVPDDKQVGDKDTLNKISEQVTEVKKKVDKVEEKVDDIKEGQKDIRDDLVVVDENVDKLHDDQKKTVRPPFSGY